MTTEQAKRFKYWQYRTIIATMIGYALFYFVRKNFSFAIPGLAAEYGITNTSFGLIMTVVGLIYGLSRFMNGLIADRMNGRWHMSLGLLLCVLTSFAFGFSPRILGIEVGVAPHSLVVLFGVLLVANNIFQGSGFPPCARLLTHWIPPTELATKMSVWNTSHSIGASLLAILCGYIMGTFGRDMSGDAQVVEAIRTNVLTLNPALADDPVRLGEQVTAAVNGWFTGQRLGQSVLLAQLGSMVFACDGVANCRVTAPGADVAISAGQLPVLGTLTVEELA